MNVPTIFESGIYQPWFVMKTYMLFKKKKVINIIRLLEFGYSSERFDIIKNYQEVDWNYYRNYVNDLRKSYIMISLKNINNVLKSFKKNKVIYNNSESLGLNKRYRNPFLMKPHNVPLNWMDEDMINLYSSYPIYNIKPKYQKIMHSRSNSYPNYLRLINDKCLRKWNECY